MSPPATAAATPRHVVDDIPGFRTRRRQRPRLAYENVLDENAPTEAATIVADGWKLGPFPRIALQAPLAWDEICAQNRSWHFHLQAWDPIATVLAAYDSMDVPAYFGWALELAVDWARSFPHLGFPSPFAWYDMALGLRAYRLAYVLDVAARLEHVPDEDIAWLLSAVDLHREALADDSAFAGHSNHGFYQAAGQLALARRLGDLPGMEAAFEQGIGRFRHLMETHFSDDGIHLEHSPEYQWILMQSLSEIVSAGLVADEPVIERFARVQEAMAWFFLPNGQLVMFGDSTPRSPELGDWKHMPNQALRFVASGGAEGGPPAERVRLFTDGGYAVLRDRWPVEDGDWADCTYLAQTCGFHSRVHKHADDMSFVWYDRSREILADSGRYGYVGKVEQGSELFEQGFHYSDPKRVYVESTRAHNTVEIDGRSYPRRRVPFYGSGIVCAGESDGVLYAECELRHQQSIRHARVLLLCPGQWLIVFDWLQDGNGDAHDFNQWFQFAPALAVARGDSEQLLCEFGDGERLTVAPLLPGSLGELASGREEPMLGWISREIYTFEPRTSACYAARSAAHTFATLLAFGSEPIAPDHERSSVAGSGRRAALRWYRDRERHDVVLARQTNEELEVSYTVS